MSCGITEKTFVGSVPKVLNSQFIVVRLPCRIPRAHNKPSKFQLGTRKIFFY